MVALAAELEAVAPVRPDGRRQPDRRLTVDEVASWNGRPLILFVGISTSGSVAHAVFDRWAAELGRPWTLRGIDVPADENAATLSVANGVARTANVTATNSAGTGPASAESDSATPTAGPVEVTTSPP